MVCIWFRTKGLGEEKCFVSVTLALQGGSQELTSHLVYPVSDPSGRNIVSKNKVEGDGPLAPRGAGLHLTPYT